MGANFCVKPKTCLVTVSLFQQVADNAKAATEKDTKPALADNFNGQPSTWPNERAYRATHNGAHKAKSL